MAYMVPMQSKIGRFSTTNTTGNTLTILNIIINILANTYISDCLCIRLLI